MEGRDGGTLFQKGEKGQGTFGRGAGHLHLAGGGEGRGGNTPSSI